VLQPTLGLRLRNTLGPEPSQDLGDALEEVSKDMLTMAAERFDSRLVSVECNLRREITRAEAGVHIALAEGLAKIRTDASELRTDVLRWSFVFRAGQLAATAALFGLMLRLMGR
jgi:hypothetical protein